MNSRPVVLPRSPWFLLGILTLAAILLHGYHLGVQDHAIYLPAIKKLLDPALYPHDAPFFLSQARWMWFDEIIAAATRLTHLPVDWLLFLLHPVTVFFALLGCRQLSVRCFRTEPERWGALIMVAAVLSLPATGTLAALLENYVHPRNPAIAALLMAFPAALNRRWSALLWLALGALFHPLMVAIGAVHIGIVCFWRPPIAGTLAAGFLLPFFALTPESTAWQQVLATRRHLFLLRWTWYEWLGVVVPLLFLFWYSRRAREEDGPAGSRVAHRIVFSTLLFIAAGIFVSVTPGFERLIPAQPMRGVHLTFLLFFFFVGASLGGWFCKTNLLRWALVLIPVCLGMSFLQWRYYPATAHIEWPGARSQNEWMQAFAWIRANTPRDALFALDPLHMEMTGQDSHGFRAFAERSMLADYVKDRAVAGLTPSMAPRWLAEWRAQKNWKHFQPDDFARLRQLFGVTWVLLPRPAPASFDCPWTGKNLAVCRVPEILPGPPPLTD